MSTGASGLNYPAGGLILSCFSLVGGGERPCRQYHK